MVQPKMLRFRRAEGIRSTSDCAKLDQLKAKTGGIFGRFAGMNLPTAYSNLNIAKTNLQSAIASGLTPEQLKQLQRQVKIAKTILKATMAHHVALKTLIVYVANLKKNCSCS